VEDKEKVKPATAKAVEEAGKTTAPVTKPLDEFPNRAKYEDGYVFNFPMSHYAARTEEEIRQSLVDAPTEEEHIEPHMKLISEALVFHKMGFRKKEEPKAS